MTETDAVNAAMRLKALAEKAEPDWRGPWEPMNEGMSVWGTNQKIGGGQKLIDIRGWGYLTGQGHGALALSERDAIAKQQALSDHIAACDPQTILTLCNAILAHPPVPAEPPGVNAELVGALELMLSHGEYSNWFATRGDEEVCEQARAAIAKAKSSAPQPAPPAPSPPGARMP